MTDYAYYLLLGSGAAAIIAAFGLGLVITYQGSGVVNFAYGAIGALGVFIAFGSIVMATAAATLGGTAFRYFVTDSTGSAMIFMILIGALPTWNYSRNWGYGPSGGLGSTGAEENGTGSQPNCQQSRHFGFDRCGSGRTHQPAESFVVVVCRLHVEFCRLADVRRAGHSVAPRRLRTGRHRAGQLCKLEIGRAHV